MASKQKNATKKLTKNEKYLGMVFSLMKKRDGTFVSDRKTPFNNTEIRLLNEIISAKYEGRRLISTQLAGLLGVTRSAISQIVNHLEEQGVVRRVPDDVDRKIAYIEITDSMLKEYGEDMKAYLDFVGRVVEKFGEDKFNTMCSLLDEFMEKIENEKTILEQDRKNR